VQGGECRAQGRAAGAVEAAQLQVFEHEKGAVHRLAGADFAGDPRPPGGDQGFQPVGLGGEHRCGRAAVGLDEVAAPAARDRPGLVDAAAARRLGGLDGEGPAGGGADRRGDGGAQLRVEVHQVAASSALVCASRCDRTSRKPW
jgi:hypothetical protein